MAEDNKLNFKIGRAIKIKDIGTIRAVSILDNKVFYGLENGEIKIFDISKQTLLYTIKAHTSAIYSLVIKDNKIISSSEDKTIKIWGLYTNKFINTISTGTTFAVSLAVKNNLIIAGLIDGNIGIWNINTGSSVKQIEWYYDEPQNELYTILVKDNFIISNSNAKGDNIVRIWNINKGILVKKVYCDNEEVLSISIKDEILAICANDETIKLYDINTNELTDTIHTTDIIEKIIIHDQLLFGVSINNEICIWDINTGDSIKSFEFNNVNVMSFGVNDAGIALGTAEGILYIFPFTPLIREGQIYSGIMSEYNLARNLVKEIGAYFPDA